MGDSSLKVLKESLEPREGESSWRVRNLGVFLLKVNKELCWKYFFKQIERRHLSGLLQFNSIIFDLSFHRELQCGFSTNKWIRNLLWLVLSENRSRVLMLLEEKAKLFWDTHQSEMVCLGNSTSSELHSTFPTRDGYVWNLLISLFHTSFCSALPQTVKHVVVFILFIVYSIWTLLSYTRASAGTHLKSKKPQNYCYWKYPSFVLSFYSEVYISPGGKQTWITGGRNCFLEHKPAAFG